MSDRLTTQLGEGALERLRELAGGERKVGPYLTQVIAWLWEHKEQLEAAPLDSYTLTLTKEAKMSMQLANLLNAFEKYASRLGKLEDLFYGLLTEQDRDMLEARARQHMEFLFGRYSDEDLKQIEVGEWFAEMLSKLSDEEIAELKAKARRKVPDAICTP